MRRGGKAGGGTEASRVRVHEGTKKCFSLSSHLNPRYSLGRGAATAGGGASQGSTCTSKWVRRRTLEEKAAARLWGLWAASRHSRYWSSSQPRGLMPSSSGGGEKQAKAGRLSRAKGEAGLDRSRDWTEGTGWWGMGSGSKAPHLYGISWHLGDMGKEMGPGLVEEKHWGTKPTQVPKGPRR